MNKSARLPAMLLCALLCTLLLAGCGGTSAAPGYTEDSLYAEPSQPAYASEEGNVAYAPMESSQAPNGLAQESQVHSETGESLNQPQDGRKVILDASVHMETLEYDETVTALRRAIGESGGYISASSTSGEAAYGRRSAIVTARIPAGAYDSFMNAVASSGTITSRQESSEDITAQYVDVQARLESLETQKTRLTELAEQAGSLEDLLTIQEKLTEVQYQIEYYTAMQRSYDDLVSYSTVTLYISEVAVVTETPPDTYGTRIVNAFKHAWRSTVSFLQEFLIFLVLALPVLVLLAIAGVITFILVRRSAKKRKLNPTPPPPAAQPQGYYYGAPAAYPGMPPQQRPAQQPAPTAQTKPQPEAKPQKEEPPAEKK